MYRFKGGLSKRVALLPVLMVFILACGSLLVFAAGCVGSGENASEKEPAWVQSVIYFGRNIPAGVSSPRSSSMPSSRTL
jgi:hypothetical protein